MAVPAIGSVAGLQVILGQLHRAAETYQDVLELVLESDRTAPLAARVYSGMSRLRYEWNDLEAATHDAREGIRLGELWGSVDVLAGSYIALSRVLQAQGDLDGAQEALQEVEQLARKHSLSPGLMEEARACRVRLWLAWGDLVSATRWAEQSHLGLNDDFGPIREIEYLALARVLTARREWDKATHLLAWLRQAAQAGDRRGRLVEILALQAVALRAQGDTAQAITTLEGALSLAEPEGYVRTFVDEGEPMAALLRTAAARGMALEYVTQLLAAFADETIGHPRTPQAPDSSLVEPLSERELEVLRLIAAGLSNREIAEELFVALSTVKKHINHIYGKLEVRSRTQALAKARELGLL